MSGWLSIITKGIDALMLQLQQKERIFCSIYFVRFEGAPTTDEYCAFLMDILNNFGNRANWIE
jgi:hypothetical protein